jgi:erythronate-4-phosphate dehydrogenase
MILIDQNIPRLKEALKCIEGLDIDTFSGRELTNKTLKDKFCKYLFVRSTTKVDEELLAGTQVEFVATATAGTDHFDWDYLERTNIKAVSAGGANSNSVAEYPVYAALKYAKSKGLDLRNLKSGVIGFGYIGSKVAKYFSDLGMEVLVNDSLLKAEGYEFPNYVKYGKVEDIFGSCDIITNHIPLSTDADHPTAGWFDSDWLGKIKKGSLFIHSSRGKILDEAAALESLRKNDIVFAIDVWENEPDFHPELARECMLSTAHIGAYSAQGKVGGAKAVAELFQEHSSYQPDFSAFDLENAPEVIAINNFDSHDELFTVLEERRKFDTDSQNLLSLSNLEPEERKKGFDRLRKEYPIRYESLIP